MASVNRLALRLSKSRAPTSLLTSLQKRSYAITSNASRPQHTATAVPKPTVKASTFATKADELDAFAEVNGAKGTSAESAPSPRAVKPADTYASVETEGISATDTVLTALEVSNDGTTDWSRSYQGLGAQPFSKEAAEILMGPIDSLDVEMKPDGLIYLPEIKYRRVLNRAFGPGGWGLAPRSETHVGPKIVSREYGLICLGRLVAVARGEQEYFDPSGIPTAVEASKSNALMRCCKDLGVASELWDPRFIREFKAKYCVEIFAEHATTKKKKKLWRRKDSPKFDYPWKE
ncbi:mitochondrial genome maintenance protein MGM101 [Irpex rosettiformis]|uniref:Mitochondrial genome maintenance protein MGM101 n=1 Tax=Irpex rosettiformis TaxID=378272 RepID=A0ACB8U5A6_9APHY|nr:mitochondrial genome maintenance protein MGM101 [Irpex rosettiformis]